MALHFEQVSDRWASLIGLTGATSLPQAATSLPETASSEIIDLPSSSSSRTHATYAPDVALQSVNQLIRQALAKLYGPGASFRSPSQELAFYHALARDVDLMLIFPTGHGKSLLFQLPPFIEAEYTTVLFVLLQLLKFQFGEAAQYPITTWRSNHTPLNRPHLLVASYEDAVDIKLHNYLIQLHSESRLSRLVFDECHTLASMRSYRDNVIRWLFTQRTEKTLVPLICLSATMSH